MGKRRQRYITGKGHSAHNVVERGRKKSNFNKTPITKVIKEMIKHKSKVKDTLDIMVNSSSGFDNMVILEMRGTIHKVLDGKEVDLFERNTAIELYLYLVKKTKPIVLEHFNNLNNQPKTEQNGK